MGAAKPHNLDSQPPPRGKLVVPANAPAWITPELIAQTLDCWQSHFARALTADDAVEILINVGRLFDELEEPKP